MTSSKIIAIIVFTLLTLKSQGQHFSTAVLNTSVAHIVAKNNNSEPLKISDRALRHFQRNFAGAINERWSTNKDSFRVTFENDDAKYMVDYHRNGAWRNTIRLYDELKLPAAVRRDIRVAYPDCNIMQVNEVQYGNSVAWFVKINQDGWYKTVHVYDEYMNVVEEFTEDSER